MLHRSLSICSLSLLVLISAPHTAAAQCLLDRALPSGPVLTSTFALPIYSSARVELSGDWLAYGNKTPDSSTFVVDFFKRDGDGFWHWDQALSLPSGTFTNHHVGLDGQHALIASGSELQSYRLDPGTQTWQAEGAPFSTFWSVVEFDYDHPYAIVSDPSYDISGIFLNGQGRILEVQPGGDLVSISGFSGAVLDQFAGDGVAVAGDLVAYGASGYDGFGKANPGFVRYYRIDPQAFGGLQFLGELSDFNTTQYSDFGAELAMSEEYLAVQSADGSSSGSSGEGERIEMYRWQSDLPVYDGSIQLPAGSFSIGDAMEISGNSLAVTVRSFTGTRVLLYQRLQGNWVLRTTFDEPEGAGVSPYSLGVDGQRVVTVGSTLTTTNAADGAAWIWDFSGTECPGLVTSPRELSVSQGGEVDWLTSLAPSSAGSLYLVLGSSSGTTPGVPLGQLNVPLNYDSWSLFTLTSINQGPLQNTLGVLDNLGGAASRLTAPSGNDPALIGATLHQATLTFDPVSAEPIGVSAASALSLIP